jgi:NAD(P)-dependent dehydrogenase (short-subunit alcohol dehydrogenase family)
MPRLLEGKVTLVTGAGGGIGRATALVLACEGAKVLVSDVSTRCGEETAQLVRDADGDAIFRKADVVRAADCEALVIAAVETWGRLDGAHMKDGVLLAASFYLLKQDLLRLSLSTKHTTSPASVVAGRIAECNRGVAAQFRLGDLEMTEGHFHSRRADASQDTEVNQ